MDLLGLEQSLQILFYLLLAVINGAIAMTVIVAGQGEGKGIRFNLSGDNENCLGIHNQAGVGDGIVRTVSWVISR